ncbi:MAG: glycosyltransferase [Terracidiphilus sp.]|jgi:glycosyltransferase involved in cell wall biosynthesis
MHILHIIDSLSPEYGGPPEAVRQLVNAYLEVGAGIEVVCLDNPGETFLAGISCPVHALGQSFLGRYAYSPRLWRWLDDNAVRFDGMVMNGIWSFPGVALRFAARRAGKPYGVFAHGALDPWFNREYPLKHLKKMLYWPIQHAVLHDATAVLFTTEVERELALTSFRPSKWNSVVVPYGITDPEERRKNPQERRIDSEERRKVHRGSPAEQIEAFYGKLPELRGRPYLLFLARIHEKKGCDLLIKAFAKIASSVPEADLVIAGTDQMGMQASLQRQAKKLGIAARVHWPGLLGGDLKWGALRACDAFILPSHQENFGIAVVEALAVGRPVLISNQVNIWREIEGDGVGLVAADTLEGTERLLRRWFDLLPADRDAMAARARPSFVARYAMCRTAMVINQLFTSAELDT